MNNIGAEIRVARQLKKKTQRKLCEELELDPTYLCQIEKGNRFPSLHLLNKIADALDCAVVLSLTPKTTEDETAK